MIHLITEKKDLMLLLLSNDKKDRFYVKFLRPLNFLGLVNKKLKWNFKMELFIRHAEDDFSDV